MDSQESHSSVEDTGEIIRRYIQILRESSDKEEILDAIEELRTHARGDGTVYL